MKFISTTLCIVLVVTNSAQATWPEASVWADRRRPAGLETGIDAEPHLSQKIPRTTAATDLFDAVPPSYGTIRTVSRPKNARAGKVLIHIQDVHENIEAQTNISLALQKLFDGRRIGVVALEGAAGPIQLDAFREFPYRDGVRQAADHLLQENKISGPIHAAFLSSNAVPPIIGIDDSLHYKNNVDAYLRSARLMGPRQEKLREAQKEIDENKNAVFNPALLSFDRAILAYHKGRAGAGDYAKSVARYAKNVPDAVKQFLEAADLEASLDAGKIQAERTKLLSQLIPKLTNAERDDFLRLSAAHRQGNLGHDDFYDVFSRLCATKGISLDRALGMKAYLRYLRLYDSLSVDDLFRDLRKMEAEAYAAVSRTGKEKELLRRSRRLYLTGKLANFALTKEEWDEYKTSAARDRALDMRPFESFYVEAEARDRAMARNLLSAMSDANASVAILVTGGFHASGINDEMTNAGITTITFVPRITRLPPDDRLGLPGGSAYLSVFLQEKTPLDRLFEGEKLFLAKPPLPPASRRLMGLHCVRLGALAGAASTAFLQKWTAHLFHWTHVYIHVGAGVVRLTGTFRSMSDSPVPFLLNLGPGWEIHGHSLSLMKAAVVSIGFAFTLLGMTSMTDEPRNDANDDTNKRDDLQDKVSRIEIWPYDIDEAELTVVRAFLDRTASLLKTSGVEIEAPLRRPLFRALHARNLPLQWRADLREALLRGCEPVLMWEAKRLDSQKVPDVFSICYPALIKAVETYDPTREEFSTYAITCIWRYYEQKKRPASPSVSLDARAEQGHEASVGAASYEDLSAVLNYLERREQIIVKMLVGLGTERGVYTQASLGTLFKISGERVRQINDRAIQTIRRGQEMLEDSQDHPQDVQKKEAWLALKARGEPAFDDHRDVYIVEEFHVLPESAFFDRLCERTRDDLVANKEAIRNEILNPPRNPIAVTSNEHTLTIDPNLYPMLADIDLAELRARMEKLMAGLRIEVNGTSAQLVVTLGILREHPDLLADDPERVLAGLATRIDPYGEVEGGLGIVQDFLGTRLPVVWTLLPDEKAIYEVSFVPETRALNNVDVSRYLAARGVVGKNGNPFDPDRISKIRKKIAAWISEDRSGLELMASDLGLSSRDMTPNKVRALPLVLWRRLCHEYGIGVPRRVGDKAFIEGLSADGFRFEGKNSTDWIRQLGIKARSFMKRKIDGVDDLCAAADITRERLIDQGLLYTISPDDWALLSLAFGIDTHRVGISIGRTSDPTELAQALRAKGIEVRGKPSYVKQLKSNLLRSLKKRRTGWEELADRLGVARGAVTEETMAELPFDVSFVLRYTFGLGLHIIPSRTAMALQLAARGIGTREAPISAAKIDVLYRKGLRILRRRLEPPVPSVTAVALKKSAGWLHYALGPWVLVDKIGHLSAVGLFHFFGYDVSWNYQSARHAVASLFSAVSIDDANAPSYVRAAIRLAGPLALGLFGSTGVFFSTAPLVQFYSAGLLVLLALDTTLIPAVSLFFGRGRLFRMSDVHQGIALAWRPSLSASTAVRQIESDLETVPLRFGLNGRKEILLPIESLDGGASELIKNHVRSGWTVNVVAAKIDKDRLLNWLMADRDLRAAFLNQRPSLRLVASSTSERPVVVDHVIDAEGLAEALESLDIENLRKMVFVVPPGVRLNRGTLRLLNYLDLALLMLENLTEGIYAERVTLENQERFLDLLQRRRVESAA